MQITFDTDFSETNSEFADILPEGSNNLTEAFGTPKIFHRGLQGSGLMIGQSCIVRFDEMMCANDPLPLNERPEYCDWETIADPACDGFDDKDWTNQLFFVSIHLLEKYDFSILLAKLDEE